MNLIKGKNHIVNSIYAEENFNKFQHLLMIKAPTNLVIETAYLNIIKAIYDRSMINVLNILIRTKLF